jgi:hypothetical protein
MTMCIVTIAPVVCWCQNDPESIRTQIYDPAQSSDSVIEQIEHFASIAILFPDPTRRFRTDVSV